MSDLIFSAPAGRADLDKAVREIKLWVILSLIGIASLAIVVAKL